MYALINLCYHDGCRCPGAIRRHTISNHNADLNITSSLFGPYHATQSAFNLTNHIMFPVADGGVGRRNQRFHLFQHQTSSGEAAARARDAGCQDPGGRPLLQS